MSGLLTLGAGRPRPASGGAAFAPTDIAGLQFWVAARLESFANNDPVGTWTDRSGNTRNATQSTAGLKPTFKTSQINSLPSIEFDGTDDTLATASFSVSQPHTIFLVMKQVTWTNADRFFDTSGGAVIRQSTADPTIQLVISSGITTSSLSGGSFGILKAVVNGASSAIAVNGGSDTTGDLGSTTGLAKVTLGSRSDGTQAANVSIAECLVYNSVISGTNLTNLLAYLNGLYAIY